MPSKKTRLASIFALLLLVCCAGAPARASVTLLLEEPYGHLGAFTGVGHAAVYLPRVCAETPLKLRRCQPGESGVVLSRYHHVGGDDWVAIPLIPYLYALDKPADVPLYADDKLVAFLRNHYRRNHLESVAPDDPDGEPPRGNWVELVGAAYDRALYGFEVETTAAQDDELIARFNDAPNREHYHVLSHNCADFVARVLNFYYPKAVHRSYLADVGIMTPKQVAKSLVKYGRRHPEMQLSTFIIPQVPGSLPRSTRAHGVVESFLKSKKYMLPTAVLHPFIIAGLGTAYVVTGIGRFNPAHNALVLNSSHELGPPLAAEERKVYEERLEALLGHGRDGAKAWRELQAEARPAFDSSGQPVLEVWDGEKVISIGLTRGNILDGGTPPQVSQDLLAARLREELHPGGDPRAAASTVTSDWELLRRANLASESPADTPVLQWP
ncbi:MAG TPA: hypothetical protein VLV49_03490 [Terriglobales bacterium]|nr:hypothetical protein [Terriglobales bacterium]